MRSCLTVFVRISRHRRLTGRYQWIVLTLLATTVVSTCSASEGNVSCISATFPVVLLDGLALRSLTNVGRSLTIFSVPFQITVTVPPFLNETAPIPESLIVTVSLKDSENGW